MHFKEIKLLQKERTLTVTFSDNTQTQYTQVDISSIELTRDNTVQLILSGQEKSYTLQALYAGKSL